MTLRRGESLMVTIAIPVGILVFFGKVDALGSAIKGDPIDFLVPGVLALAVMANTMVSLGDRDGLRAALRRAQAAGIDAAVTERAARGEDRSTCCSSRSCRP